ncbi:DNA gyrase subunit A [uncultured archaeon]|nr:DNA gyrase subunit A [uncultured archaeon]
MSKVNAVRLEDELQSSYIDYAMSVIIGRAIPDVRDGLKPVERKILYGMYNINNVHSQPTKKSAKIVGEVMGKFHPHGDMALYGTLVRMAQNFSMNHTLVEGQGNFGSVDGDPPAAMRYTEVRLAKIAEELLNDLDKGTVKFVPNFDNTEKEPELLPSAFPNLLLNGAAGIAVGVATSIPPHNLGEICDAIVCLLEKKDATVDDVMGIVKGPDFPTGGIAIMSGNAFNGYRYGRGQLTIKAKAEIDEKKGRIVITEFPYNVNKASFVENVAHLARDKRIVGIRDIRDESDRKGISVVIELKNDAEPQQILNQLFKHTSLEVTFPLIYLAVHGKSLQSLNILQLFSAFITYRREVVTNRSRYELNVAKDRLHIVEGLLLAITKIDEIIAAIKGSREIGEARSGLISGFGLTEKQANAILDMKLGRLTHLESDSLNGEKKELEGTIGHYAEILADPAKIDAIIRAETLEIRRKYATPRKTELLFMEEEGEIQDEDLISDEQVSVILTNSGYVKRLNISNYKEQERGGKGIIAMNLKEGDFVKQVTTARNKDYIIFVTDQGRIFWLKAYNVPEGSRYSEGRAVANLLKLEKEKVVTMFNIKDFANSKIFFLTAKGVVKKIRASLFSKPRSNGVRAITLRGGDSIADVSVYTNEEFMIVTTAKGKSIKFKEATVRSIGRSAAGVRGIRLRPEDSARNVISASSAGSLLTISEKGYGKITEIGKYRIQGRGGSGIMNLKVNEKTGPVAKALFVGGESKTLLLMNSAGVSITIPIASIRITGRAASGVRLMKLAPGIKVIDAEVLNYESVAPAAILGQEPEA